MKNISRIILAVILFSPVFARAAPGDNLNLQRQGIFDCNQNGAYAMSVGALGATGGVYVPVADAAVELNTGILVYKECVLREVIIRMREAAMAGFTKITVTSIQTGRNGNAQYVRRQGELLENASDPEFLSILRDGTLQSLDSAFEQQITRALVRSYESDTRAPEGILTCRYQGDLKAALDGQPKGSIWDALSSFQNPACNPLGAYHLAKNLADSRIAACAQYLQNQWDWGRGYYPVTDDPNNPCRAKILTPAVNVQQSFQTLLDSPVRQLESANDIGQMINALYAGMTTQIISDNQGLAGLTQSIGGQPSYIDQVVKEANQGLRDAVTNLALQNLQAAQQVEAAYFQTVNKIAAALTTAILQLQSAEKQCWDLIVYQDDGRPERHVCTGPPAADNTCVSSGGDALKVATSSAFSRLIIARDIEPIATTTLARIKASQNALNLIARLIEAVTGASLDAQRLAIIQLNSLIAQKLLHVQPDLDGPNGVIKQLDSVQTAMLGSEGLVTKTIELWANSVTVRPGWCNVNNPAVLEAWKKCWDKNNPDKAACPTP